MTKTPVQVTAACMALRGQLLSHDAYAALFSEIQGIYLLKGTMKLQSQIDAIITTFGISRA